MVDQEAEFRVRLVAFEEEPCGVEAAVSEAEGRLGLLRLALCRADGCGKTLHLETCGMRKYLRDRASGRRTACPQTAGTTRKA